MSYSPTTENQLPGTAPTDIDTRPENPVHSLDVFSRGFPVLPQFFNGFRRKQIEVMMSPQAMRQVLSGIDIRPTSLVMNPRAHLFPEKIEGVVFQTKSSLFDYTLAELSEYEGFNRRTLGHVFSYGLVGDINHVSPRSSIIPYGIFHKNSTLIGSEVWQINRKSERAAALKFFIEQDQKRKANGDDSNISSPLPSPEEMAQLSPEEQLSIYRFTTDFGQIAVDQIPEEKRAAMLRDIQQKEQEQPFLHANFYRVNYYTCQDGNFFYSDVLPDERSSFRQWAEWSWLKASNNLREFLTGEVTSPHRQTKEVAISDQGVKSTSI